MKNSLLKYAIALSSAVLCLTIDNIQSAHALSITAPNNLATVEGNSASSSPFGSVRRYQQVYNSSEFSALMGPAKITQILFRRDQLFRNANDVTTNDIQINLSTTSRGADELSRNFVNNIGSDDTLVLSRRSLSLSTAGKGPAEGPKEFDIVVDLDNPFFYDPSLGNLLLDVRKPSTSIGSLALDAAFSSNDGISQVFATRNGALWGTANTRGVVTQFNFEESSPTAVPTPAPLLGLVGMGVAAIRKRRSETAIEEV